jgi:hypothetical protein
MTASLVMASASSGRPGRLRVAPGAGQGPGEVSAVVTNRLFRALTFHHG